MSRHRVQLNEYGELLGGLQQFAREDEFPDETRQRAIRLMMRVFEEQLTQRQKQVMTLYYFEGIPMPAIAMELGVNKSTVSRIIAGGKKRIDQCMKYWFDIR